MNTVFVLLWFLSIIALIAGLIKPSLLKMESRKKVGATVGAIFLVLFVLIAVTAEPAKETTSNQVKEETMKEEPKRVESEEKKEPLKEEKPKEEKPKEEKPKEDIAEEEEPKINTDVFQYATNVEVTDARDITGHVTITIFMSGELKQGQAAQHVLNQAYDFLQQEDIKGAKTVTIGVMHGEWRILQLTTEMSEFKPVDTEPMTDVVLKASKVEKIYPEVEEWAEIFEWNIVK